VERLSGIYKTSVPYYKSHWNRQGSITIVTAESRFDEIDLCIDQDTSESFLMNNTVSQQFLALEKGT